MGVTNNLLALIFKLVQDAQVKQDFEIKRFVIGLSSLIQRDPSELPVSVQQNQQSIMKALVFLCQKSIVVRVKNKEKEEQCEEEMTEQVPEIIEDEDNELEILSEDEEDDEDYDCQEEMERDLYDSKLDSLDEVLFCRDVFATMEQ